MFCTQLGSLLTYFAVRALVVINKLRIFKIMIGARLLKNMYLIGIRLFAVGAVGDFNGHPCRNTFPQLRFLRKYKVHWHIISICLSQSKGLWEVIRITVVLLFSNDVF